MKEAFMKLAKIKVIMHVLDKEVDWAKVRQTMICHERCMRPLGLYDKFKVPFTRASTTTVRTVLTTVTSSTYSFDRCFRKIFLTIDRHSVPVQCYYVYDIIANTTSISSEDSFEFDNTKKLQK